MANRPLSGVARFGAALIEVICIVGVKEVFALISPFMERFSAPGFISISLDYFRLGLSGIEGVFIVYSAGISIIILIARPNTKEGIREPLLDFLKECGSSALAMGLMFAVAAGIGLLNPKGVNAMESRENTWLIVILVSLFYIFGVGFLGLLLISTYNSGKVRWRVLRPA